MPIGRLRSALGDRNSQLRRVALFLVSGGIAALVNVSSRFALTPSLGFELSVVVAYMIGMMVAYVLFRIVVFGKTDRGVATESYRFVVVNIVALAVVWLVSVLLARVVFPSVGLKSFAEDIAHLIAVCVPAVTSYIGHSQYTFKRL